MKSKKRKKKINKFKRPRFPTEMGIVTDNGDWVQIYEG